MTTKSWKYKISVYANDNGFSFVSPEVALEKEKEVIKALCEAGITAEIKIIILYE